MSIFNNTELTIPRKLWHVWMAIKTDEITSKWDSARESVRKHLGHWDRQIIGLSEARKIINEIDPSFLPYFDNFPYTIQRIDAIRPFILYKYGGLYMDFDYKIEDPDFESLFSGSSSGSNRLYLVLSGNVKSYYTNSFMASTPNHPFWWEVIQEMKKKPPWYAFGKHMTVMNTTGPIMLTRVAHNTHSTITLLPTSEITPCSACNTNCVVGITKVSQLEGSTWIGWDSHVLLWSMCNQNRIYIGIFIAALLIIILFILFLLWDFIYRPRRIRRQIN